MAWQLQIRHIDLTTKGDSTLIIVREVPPLIGMVPIIRSALIDGGVLAAGPTVDAYINNIFGIYGVAALDVMIATHYDTDHFNGLRYLLNLGGAGGAPNFYDNVNIFDQGRPGTFGLDAAYNNYVNAINLRGARSRVTRRVFSDPGGPPPVWGLAAPIGGWLPHNWLVGQEILWHGLVAVPPGAPTLTCVAANRFVLGAGVGGAGAFVGGLGVDPKNEKSLAFLLQFGNFKYYVGGDLETAQEDNLGTHFNAANTVAGRVHAMKASHHGANTATSRVFIDRIRAEAAVISCGTTNMHGHPAQEAINVLDGFPAAAVPHVAGAVPPNHYVDHYLTGYQVPGPPSLSFAGDRGMTAGDPVGVVFQPGHIRITVSQAQSGNNAAGALGGAGVVNGLFNIRFYDQAIPGFQHLTHT